KNIELNWPMGAFFDVEAVVRAYAWMRGNADIIVPHHDWASSTGIPTEPSASHPLPPDDRRLPGASVWTIFHWPPITGKDSLVGRPPTKALATATLVSSPFLDCGGRGPEPKACLANCCVKIRSITSAPLVSAGRI